MKWLWMLMFPTARVPQSSSYRGRGETANPFGAVAKRPFSEAEKQHLCSTGIEKISGNE
jgi:hypothetical protein